MARVKRRRSSRRTRRIRRRGRGIKGVSDLAFSNGRFSYKRKRPSGLGLAMGMSKRRRFGPSVTTRTRRNFTDGSGVNQWSEYRATKKLGRLTQRKLNRVLTDEVTTIWRRVNRLITGGNIQLNNYYDTATGTIGWPMLIMDLTTNNQGVPAWMPQRKAAGIEWVAYNCFTPTGTQDPKWQSYRNGELASINVQDFILKSVSVKADLWGATNGPVKWRISLVQLGSTAHSVLPEGMGFDSTTKTDTFPQTLQYWDGFFKKLTFNPSISDPTTGTGKMWKTLWSRSFTINPSLSVDQDTDPTCKSVKFHFKMNRRCNFQWAYRDLVAPGLADVHTTKWDPQDVLEVYPTVHPKARVYLMITASQFSTAATAAAQPTAKTPTLNLEVQRRVMANVY